MVDFAERVGISRSRLFKLWSEGRGPQRVRRKATRWRGEPAVLIPLSAGLAWNAERLANRPESDHCSALKNQLRAVHSKLADVQA